MNSLWKWIIAAAAALAVGFLDLLPFESVDAGALYIVETLMVEMENGEVRLYAGAADGSGATVKDAAADMERSAPGMLFLRQTKRIIFCGGAENEVDFLSLPEDLPMGTGVYVSALSAEDLLENQERLEQILEARERREEGNLPTLAELKNNVLKEQSPGLAAIEEENGGES